MFRLMFLKFKRKKNNKEIIRNRLQNMLTKDRARIRPEDFVKMKAEVESVISKYLSIDSAQSCISIKSIENSPVMRADFKIKNQ